MNLGILATIRGDFDRAGMLYQSSLSLYEQLESQGSIARIHHNLGMCFSSRENWAEALDSFEKSLEISQDQGNIAQSASTYVQKAVVYLELADLTVAATYCARAVDAFREIDYPLGLARAYKVLGRLFTQKEDWATARGLLDESLRLYVEYGDQLGEAETKRELGRLHRARHDGEAARRSLEEALGTFEHLDARHDGEVTQKELDDL